MTISKEMLIKHLNDSLTSEINEHIDTQEQLKKSNAAVLNLLVELIKHQGIVEYLEGLIFEEEEEEDEEIELIFEDEDKED
jgi:hypothetical protein